MKTNVRRTALVIVAASLIVMSGAAAWATSGYTSYNTTVGKFNGSGYTGQQVKTTTGLGFVYTNSVGGGYKVDARLTNSTNSHTGSWARSLGSGGGSSLSPGNVAPGDLGRVQFSNNITTPVDVQVFGSFTAS